MTSISGEPFAAFAVGPGAGSVRPWTRLFGDPGEIEPTRRAEPDRARPFRRRGEEVWLGCVIRLDCHDHSSWLTAARRARGLPPDKAPAGTPKNLEVSKAFPEMEGAHLAIA